VIVGDGSEGWGDGLEGWGDGLEGWGVCRLSGSFVVEVVPVTQEISDVDWPNRPAGVR
jgi:hypothetical protein